MKIIYTGNLKGIKKGTNVTVKKGNEVIVEYFINRFNKNGEEVEKSVLTKIKKGFKDVNIEELNVEYNHVLGKAGTVKKNKVKKNIPVYACDFETNTEEWIDNERDIPEVLSENVDYKYEDFKRNDKIEINNSTKEEISNFRKGWKNHKKNDKAFVWCWGYSEIKKNMTMKGELDNFTFGYSIEEFVDWLLDGSKNTWFHNLKFDGSYVVSEILRRGYKFTFEQNPAVGEFTGLIDEKKMWFNIDICVEGNYGNRHFVTIKDSLKKVPFGLSKVADAFGMDVFKDEMDYDIIRTPYEPMNYLDFKYLKKDVEITAKVILHQVFENGLNKTTVGSDALNEFKKSIGGDKEFRNLFPVLDYDVDSFIRKSYFGGITQVKPGMEGKEIGEGCVFDINSMYPFIQYYKLLPYGEPEYYEGKYIEDEEYPLYIQRVNFSFEIKKDMLPIIQLKKRNIDKIFEMDELINFSGRDYQQDSEGHIVGMYLTNIQWEQIQRHYDVDNVEYIEGYKFKAQVGLFRNHIDKWIKVKDLGSETGNGALKELGKLMLNSPYGKFGTGIYKVNVEPYIGDNGELRFKVEDEDLIEDMDEVEFEKYMKENSGKPVYTAYASFVTAYAREELVNTIMLAYDRFVYCDTDSIHLIGTETPEAIKHKIHKKDLGMWDKEGEFKKAKFIRAKTYCEMLFAKKIKKKDRWGDIVDSVKHVSKEEWEGLNIAERTLDKNLKCAGMQKHIADVVDFDEFKIGLKIDPNDKSGEYVKRDKKGKVIGKLMPSQVKGGTLLKLRKFSLN